MHQSIKTFCLLAITVIGLSHPAHAQEEESTAFGIAMHGKPKYTKDHTHLDYANPTAPKGGAIKTAAIGTFDTLNPYALKGKAAQGLNLVYGRLMDRVWDEPFSMYPLIAESYEMPEDRSSITFTLNQKAQFNDGTPITVEDIAFSFETLKTSGRPNMRNVYKIVKNVEIQDDRKITFTFDERHDQETALIIAMMPVLSKSYWQNKEFDSTTLDYENLSKKLNGPYRIKSIDPGRSITYQRIKNYWAQDFLTNKGHYNFDEITYTYFRDDSVAFEAFASGDLNYRYEHDVGKWATAYDFPAIKTGTVVQESIPHQRPERTRGFIFNTRRAPFDDIRVRKALTLLFDPNWINKNLFYGEYEQIDSFFPNSELASPVRKTNNTSGSRAKMRQAAQLLEEAGWIIENGKRVKNGTPLTFETILAAPEEEKIALHFQQALQRLGITMNIRVLDSASFIRRLNAYDYDMVLHHWQTSLSPGTEQILYWGCEAAQQQGRFNYAGICDPKIDSLAKSVAQTKTRDALVTTMQTLDQQLLDGFYMIPLFYGGKDFIAHKSNLQHSKTIPIYGSVLETWWMDKKETQNTIEER